TGGGMSEDPRIEEERDRHLEVRFPVKSGQRQVAVTFPNRTWYMENVGVSRLPARSSSYAGGVNSDRNQGRIDMALGRIEIGGPFDGRASTDSPTGRQLFVCTRGTPTEDEPCARSILRTLVRRAYRRPATADDLTTLLAFYRTGRKSGTFDRGIQLALERVLS